MGRVLFSDCAYSNGNMYFFSNQDGMMARLDIESNIITYLPVLVEELYDKGDSVDKVLTYDNRLYALSNAGNALVEYNLLNNEYLVYNPECAMNSWGNYIYMTQYGGKIFIFTRARNVVKVFDCDNKEFITIEYDMKEQTFFAATRVDDVVWLFPRNGRVVVKFDLKNGTVQKYIVDYEFENVVDCYPDDNNIYVVSSSGNIIIFDMHTTKLSVFHMSKENEKIRRLIVSKDNVVLLPSGGENIIVINKNNRNVKKYEQYPEGFEYQANPKWSKYHGYCKFNNKIYFAMRSANHLLIIDEETGEISWKRPMVGDAYEEVKILLKNKKLNFKEDKIFLKDYLKCIAEGVKVENLDEKLNIGEKIYASF